MADLATLKIAVDSRDVKSAQSDLEALARSSSSAEAQVNSLNQTARSTNAGLSGMQQALRQAQQSQKAASEAMGALGGSTRLASHHVQNLTFQLNDLFVGLASGQRPLTVFMQQGSQIAGIMGQAQIGVKGLIVQLVRMAGAVALMVATNPYLLALAAAATAAFVAFKDFKAQADASGELQRTVDAAGLTKKELKELGTIGITLGDVFRGLWITIRDTFNLGPALSSAKQMVMDFGRAALDVFKNLAAASYGLFVGAFNAVKGLINGQGWNFTAEVNKATNSALAGMKRFGEAWSKNTMAAAQTRLQGEIQAILDDRTERKMIQNKKAADDYRQSLDDLQSRVLQSIRALPDYAAAVGGSIDAPFKALMERIEIARQVAQEASEAAWEAARKAMDDFTALSPQIDLDGAFGDTGRAMGAMLNSFDQLIERAHLFGEAIAQANAKGYDTSALLLQNARLQMNAYGNITGAAKGFFKEGSKGYKTLEKAERAFRTVELALAISTAVKKIALIGSVVATKTGGDAAMAVSDTARAGVEQGNSILTTGVKAVEAVVNAIRSMPFPLNLAAGAATAAAIAALGVSIAGGSKSAALMTNTGTGTVFGDKDAQSESLTKAIEHLADIDTKMLRYSSQMASSLRNIENNIGGLTSLVLRTTGIQASGAGVSTGTKGPFDFVSGLPLIGGLLGGIGKALFGTKTTIVGQGIYGGAQSLGDIMAGGFDASYYTDVKKKKKFFGFTSSVKYSTQYSEASSEIERQFGLILTGFADAIKAASGPLGMNLADVEAKLSAFTVNIGKIDLKGLTGEEINEKLTAVFGAAADNIASAVLPGFEQFQQVGEGYFETVVRVSSSVEALRFALDGLGVAASNLSITASMDLIDLFGSLSNLTSATEEYFSLFYSEEEQLAVRTRQLTSALANLGLTMPSSIQGFRALVDAQNLATEAGRAAYAALIQLAPAFAQVMEATTNNTAAAERAAAAQRRAEQREQAREQAANNLRSAYQREASALEATASKFRDLAASLRSFSESITGQASPQAGLARLQAQFTETARLARLGNQDAMRNLPTIGGQLRDAITANATDRVSMMRGLLSIAADADAAAGVADRQASIADQQLAQMKAQVSRLISIDENMQTVAQAIAAFVRLGGSRVRGYATGGYHDGGWRLVGENGPELEYTGPSQIYNANQTSALFSQGEVAAEVRNLRSEMRAALYQVAKNTGKTQTLLDRWDGDGLPETRDVAA